MTLILAATSFRPGGVDTLTEKFRYGMEVHVHNYYESAKYFSIG